MTDWTKGIPEPAKPDTTDQTAAESPETTGGSADTADSPQGGPAAPFGAVDWTKHPSTAATAPSKPATSTPASTPTDPRSTTRGTGTAKTDKTALFSRTARSATKPKPTTSTAAAQPQGVPQPSSQRRKSLMIFGSLAAACVIAIVGAIVIVDTTGGDDGADGADSSGTANTANGAGGEQVDMHNTADTTQGPGQNSDQSPDQAPAGSAEDPDPDPSAPAVSGTCTASQDEVKVAASPNSPRGVIAEFEKQYFAGNATAIPDLLTGDSSMQDNDWAKVLDQVADDSEYCLRMNPVADNSGGRVALELAITTDGERTVYRQVAETTSVTPRADSSDTTRWFIKEIRKAS